LDVYVDTDPGNGTGARLLLPGRNAALQEGSGWDAAVWAEGWYPQLLKQNAQSGMPETVNMEYKIIVDAANQKVTLRVPRELFGQGDPAGWGYAAVLLSQEGYPSTGVWRVRDVQKNAAQWRLGGAPDDSSHTRIIDLVWPAEASHSQADMLSNYTPSNKTPDELGADDFAQIELLRAAQ
jgi:hypothetical protein